MASQPANFPALFFDQVAARKDRVALRRKEHGIWNRISWKEYGEKVLETGAAMVALDIQPGERVAILGDNRPEWLFCHLAAMAIGCVTCGVYSTSAPDQVNYVVGHSESKILFVENEEQVDKVLQILPDLSVKQIVVWDPKGLWGFAHEAIVFFDEFLKTGAAYLASHPDAVYDRMNAIDPQNTAMMIYTSGTTGRPKGAMITHQNILSITESFTEATPMFDTDELLSYLPLAHIYENLISDNRVPFTTFADLTQNPDIRKLIEGEVQKVNKTLSKVETIKKFELLPRRFYEEDGDVTPTKKVKRRFLEERYKDLINKMYGK